MQIKGMGKDLAKKRGGVFDGGVYVCGEEVIPLHTMTLAITFNCDFNLLVPMSSLLISNKNKYYLATDWLDVVRR